jgi:hypothetical protein
VSTRQAVRPATILLATVAGGVAACSYFPSHEEVFQPIPITIGSARLVAGDTVYTVTGRGYRVTTPRREMLPDAVEALDQARRGWRRYFADDPPTVAVHLRWAVRQDAAGRGKGDEKKGDDKSKSPDTTHAAPPPPPPRDTADGPLRVVNLFVLARADRRGQSLALTGPVVSSRMARAWLAALYDLQTPAPDTTARTAPAGPGADRADDPRIADWIEDAIGDLMATSSRTDFLVVALARKREQVMPLAAFFDAKRPAVALVAGANPDSREPGSVDRDFPRGEGAGEYPGGGGRGERAGTRRTTDRMTLSPAQTFHAQSFAVASYFVEKEGPAFLGLVVERLAHGKSVADALAEARVVPKELSALDADFAAWLGKKASEAPDIGAGRMPPG